MRKSILKIKRADNVFSIILFLIVLGLSVFLIINGGKLKNNKDKNEETTLEDETQELIFLTSENPNEITFGKFLVSLPQGWSVTSKVRGKQIDDYICSTNDDLCDIAVVTDGVNRFYFTHPLPLKPNEDFANNIKTEDVLIDTETVSMSFQKYAIYDQQGRDISNIETPFYSEIYGCTKTNICLFSGALSLDQSLNKTQSEAFLAMVKSLVIK
jgi:hypothetical protein